MNVVSSGQACGSEAKMEIRSVTRDVIAEMFDAVAHNNTYLIEILSRLDSLANDLHGGVPQTAPSSADEAPEGAVGQLTLAILHETRLIENIRETVSRL